MCSVPCLADRCGCWCCFAFFLGSCPVGGVWFEACLSFPVDVVGCVRFRAWRIGVVAGVVLLFSWALVLLAECGLRRVCCVVLVVRS